MPASVLADSFALLRERPRLFVPRLVSTSLSTVWTVGILLLLERSRVVLAGGLYVVTAPLIVFVGVFVPVMLAAMVRDPHEAPLRSGFLAALREWPALLAITVLVLVVAVVLAVPAVAGVVVSALVEHPAPLVAGVGVAGVGVFVVGYAVYFLPITVLEDDRVVESLRASAGASRTHWREVTVLLVLSVGLLALAAVASGALEALGVVGFALGRTLSAVVGTYVVVVSPTFYLERVE